MATTAPAKPRSAARRRWLVAALAAASGAAGGVAAQPRSPREPLTIALLPFLSPTALLGAFRPLREHLERTLARPVSMLSARDFRSLCEATRTQQHDVALLPGHIAQLAIADWGYQPLASTVEVQEVRVLVRREGPQQRPADLRGARIGMLDRLALGSAAGELWLRRQGLGEAVALVTMPSINSAMYALDRGDIDAVVAAAAQLAALPAATPRSERVLAVAGEIPAAVYVVRGAMPPADLAPLREAMFAFQPDPSRPTTAANARLRPVDPALLARMEPLATMARHLLAER